MADRVLDAKGLACPMPILKAKNALKEVPKGGTLEVFATDPGSKPDFEAWCKASKNTLLEASETGGVFRFLVQHTA